MVLKGGANVGTGVVRDPRGVLERDAAAMAGPIVVNDLGGRKDANFRREMETAGDLTVMGSNYPKMQMPTVPDILEGKRSDTPSIAERGEGSPVLPLGPPPNLKTQGSLI